MSAVFFCNFCFFVSQCIVMNYSELDDDRQHLSDVQLEKLRRVIKTKISGELTISEEQSFSVSDCITSI